jgi:hypothetical protein
MYARRGSLVAIQALALLPLCGGCHLLASYSPGRSADAGRLPQVDSRTIDARGTPPLDGDALDLAAGDGAIVLTDSNIVQTDGQTTFWLDTAWTRRIRLTFDNTTRPEDLLGFPVLVVLDSTRIDYSDTAAGGKDLRFVDADNQTDLPHEIERYNDRGRSFVWVRVPKIDRASGSDFIWLYYGNAASADRQNAAAVWNSGYVGVWHLSGDFDDATGNGLQATNYGSTSAAGQIAGCRAFDGNDYLELPNRSSLALDQLTVELWFSSTQRWDATYWPGSAVLISRATASWQSNDWSLIAGRKDAEAGDMGRVILGVGAATGWAASSEPVIYSNTGKNDGLFHQAVWTRTTAGKNRLFIDGVEEDSVTDGGDTISPDRPIQIGGDPRHGNSSYLIGRIDEVRISKVVRSPHWVNAEHTAMADKLIGYGTPEFR